MKKILGLFFWLALLSLWLTSCGSGQPPLATANEPTLVFIYADG